MYPASFFGQRGEAGSLILISGMKTAEEILDSENNAVRVYGAMRERIVKAMMIYAEQAIDRCSETAFIKKNRIGNSGASVNLVDKQSILNVKSELQ